MPRFFSALPPKALARTTSLRSSPPAPGALSELSRPWGGGEVTVTAATGMGAGKGAAAGAIIGGAKKDEE
jgi:hypothetical protein